MNLLNSNEFNSNEFGEFQWKEMFYLNSSLNFGILPVLIFQLEVYWMVDRLLTGLAAQQKGTSAWWYSNKTSRSIVLIPKLMYPWHKCN